MKESVLVEKEKQVQSSLDGGFLNIDKPAGWTSHDVVAKIRRLLRIKRVGHMGTLDPAATGVLPICFGKGTKLASFVSDADKSYDAVLRLGEETDTQDASGTVTDSLPIPESLLSEEGLASIKEVMASFVGPYLQIPPMYSAIKIKGVRLYKTAREGKVVERPARKVAIRSITFQEKQGKDIAFRVDCAKGTYIRTLCADIGTKLGVGAHLLSLRRTRTGNFTIENAIDLESFAEYCKNEDWQKVAYPLDTPLQGVPALWLRKSAVSKFLNGVQIGASGLSKWDSFESKDNLRFLDHQGRLLGIGVALKSSLVLKDSLVTTLRRTHSEVVFKIKTVLCTK